MSRRVNTTVNKIDLQWLKKNGYFNSGLTLSWSRNGESTGSLVAYVSTNSDMPNLRLVYKSIDAYGVAHDMDYSFRMESIPCFLGGRKWFIRCELTRNGRFCGRRVRILYSIGRYFGCRECAQITYETCNESGCYRDFKGLFGSEKGFDAVRTRYYRGRPTKRYQRYLAKEEHLSRSFAANSQKLEAMLKNKIR